MDSQNKVKKDKSTKSTKKSTKWPQAPAPAPPKYYIPTCGIGEFEELLGPTGLNSTFVPRVRETSFLEYSFISGVRWVNYKRYKSTLIYTF